MKNEKISEIKERVSSYFIEKREGNKFNLLESLLIRFLTSWFVYYSYRISYNRNKLKVMDFVKGLELKDYVVHVLVIFFIITLVLQIINKNKEKISTVLFFSSIIALSLQSVYKQNDIYFNIGIALVVVGFVTFLLNRYDKFILEFDLEKSKIILILSLSVFAWVFIMISFALSRYLSFYSPTFDFGIFSQMFYNMKEELIPYTTCERKVLMSHFDVHMSPALYLLLPIYSIFPFPQTLLILQILLIALGIIPLYLICKRNKLSNLVTMLLSLVYVFYPTNMTGLYYDFHENKMLPVLLLWFLYFVDKRFEDVLAVKKININRALTVLFMFLVMMVKEDSAIFVACIGLYLIFSKKRFKKGGFIFVVAVVYFFLVINYLENHGDGAMTSRFSNYMLNKEDGLMAIFETLFKNPTFLISQIFMIEKLEFVLWMFLPVIFIPFKTKRYTDFILLVPLLLINLMSNWPYQYDIYFQYSYGSMALIFFLTIKNIKKSTSINAKKITVVMLAITMILGVSAMSVKLYYIDGYKDKKQEYVAVKEILNAVPDNVSVESSSYYLPHLANREVIYTFRDDFYADYLVYDLRSIKNREELMVDIKNNIDNGYKQVDFIENYISVLKKAE